MRKVRHELGLVDKRVPSGGSLGGPGGSTYCSWDSIGHVCTLMLQALQWAPPVPPPQGQGAADATSPSTAATTPARSTAPNANAADTPQPATGSNAAGGTSGEPAGSSAAAQGAGTPAAAAGDAAASTPQRGGGASASGTGAAAAAAAVAAALGGPSGSGSNTPGRGAGSGTDSPGGARAGAGGVGTSMPAPLATEAGLVRVLSHKHVVAHAKKVLRGVPEEYRAALGRLLLGKLAREMQVGAAEGTGGNEAVVMSLR